MFQKIISCNGLFLIAQLVFSQEVIIVEGQITDEKKAIENVHVKINQRNVVVKSQSNGMYHIKVPKNKNAVLVFSHLSYETVYEPVFTQKDTLHLDIVLKTKITQIPTYEFTDGKPIPVFKSTKISIADYEFYQDKFLFLVYEKKLRKDGQIILVDEQENILSKHFVPGEPVELYNDYQGNVNLICKNEIYRIQIFKDQIALTKLPLQDFNQFIKPIIDTLSSSIIFSDFLQQFPKFKYYAFDKQDTTVSVIREVVHKDMDWRYQFEYYFLSNADKQFAKRMAKKLKGYDKYDVAAYMTNFANSFLFDEIYAPLFVINDTITIFDHYNDKIWKYVNDTVLIDSVDINYHHPEKKFSWKKQLLMDEITGKIYALYQINSYYYLKSINYNTGKIEGTKKLHFQFAEKVKIKDGFVFYTYKPRQSLTKRFLYKEPF